MIPGDMFIEKVHGLQCTGIPLGDRFAMIMEEHRARLLRLRRRPVFVNKPFRVIQSSIRQMPQRTLRMSQPRQLPLRQYFGMPELRRFGSDGNLPGLQRSNSFNQFRNRIPWRQSNGNLSRAGSVTNLSQASWNSDGAHSHGGSVASLRGRMRGRGRKPQIGQFRQQPGRTGFHSASREARGRGRGRGGGVRVQQYRVQQPGGFQVVNRNHQAAGVQQVGPNQQLKPVPTKEELDAELDEYMASSQYVLDKELEDYMIKGALMDYE